MPATTAVIKCIVEMRGKEKEASLKCIFSLKGRKHRISNRWVLSLSHGLNDVKTSIVFFYECFISLKQEDSNKKRRRIHSTSK